MANLNDVTLLGNIANQPSIRYTSNGIPLWRCVLAVNRINGKHKDDKDKQADYLHVIAWDERAEELNQRTKQGSQILVKGRLQSRNYTKTNEPTGEEYADLEEIFSTLAIEDEDDLIEEVLEALQMDGRETTHTAYEVSASRVEYLKNCIFEEKKDN